MSIEPRVTLEQTDHMDSWRLIEPVLRDFSSKTGYGFSVYNEHCGYTRTRESFDDTIYVRFFCIPEEFSRHRTTCDRDDAFGFRLPYPQNRSITPNMEAAKPIEDANGIVAEIEKSTIFVLFNLPEGPNAGTLMSKILDVAIAKGYLIPDPVKRAEAKAAEDRRLTAESGTAFRSLFLNSIQSRVDICRREMDEANGEIEHHERELNYWRSKKISCADLERKAKESLEHPDPTIPDNLFEKMKQLSPTGIVKVVNDRVEVDMGHIDIVDRGEIYDIGDFTLVMKPFGSRKSVRLINRTRIIQGLYHPHVQSDGDPCLGNMGRQVYDLLDSLDLDVLVSLIMTTLRTYTSGDSYANVSYWPSKGLTPEERERRRNREH